MPAALTGACWTSLKILKPLGRSFVSRLKRLKIQLCTCWLIRSPRRQTWPPWPRTWKRVDSHGPRTRLVSLIKPPADLPSALRRAASLSVTLPSLRNKSVSTRRATRTCWRATPTSSSAVGRTWMTRATPSITSTFRRSSATAISPSSWPSKTANLPSGILGRCRASMPPTIACVSRAPSRPSAGACPRRSTPCYPMILWPTHRLKSWIS